jgi:DNA-binding transcriptional LysR family regulator
MEFYQLEAFVAVVAQRSFSKAAQQLYLSQPTVSAHVKSLETELAMPLLDRGKNEIILTSPGEKLYRYARDLLDIRANALADISSSNIVGEEILTIEASSVPCQYLLPQVVAAFELQFPLVSVALKQENSRQVCEDVHNYHYPFGIVGEKHSLPRLTYTALLKDELVLSVPNREEFRDLLNKNNPAVADIAAYKLLMREPGSGTRSFFEAELVKNGITLNDIQFTVYNNQETIKQAVRRGLGITVISRLVMEDYQEFGLVAVRSLQDLDLKREFYLVHHDKRILSPAAKALRDFIIRTYQQEGLR